MKLISRFSGLVRRAYGFQNATCVVDQARRARPRRLGRYPGKRRRWPRFDTLVSVHAVTRIGPAFLALVSLLAPAMACSLPASGMTASERACCKQMRGRCGAASMPASHRCCRTTPDLHRVDAAQPQSHWTPPGLAMVPGLPVSCAALRLPTSENVSAAWHYHPPPLSLTAGTTVLRI